LLRQARGDDVHFGLRLFHGDARFETRHGEIVVAGPGLEFRVLRIDRQRPPDLNVSRWILELGAHHSDYGIGKVLQADRLPDDVRVSRIAPLPEAVTQDDNAILSWLVLLLSDAPAQDRLHSQQGEEVGGD